MKFKIAYEEELMLLTTTHEPYELIDIIMMVQLHSYESDEQELQYLLLRISLKHQDYYELINLY